CQAGPPPEADTPGRTWTAPKWLICTRQRVEANARSAANIRVASRCGQRRPAAPVGRITALTGNRPRLWPGCGRPALMAVEGRQDSSENVDGTGDHERGQSERPGRFEHHEELGPRLDR